MLLLIDGKPIASGKAPGLLQQKPSDGMQVGVDLGSLIGPYPANYWYSGGIDEVRIFFGKHPLDALRAEAKRKSS